MADFHLKSREGHSHLSRFIALAEYPADWKALDLKLLILLTSRIDLENPWGEHSMPLKEAKAWLGATSGAIAVALKRLVTGCIRVIYDGESLNDHNLRLVFPPLADSRMDPDFLDPKKPTYYKRHFTAIVGKELTWQFTAAMVSWMSELGRGYGRVCIETVCRLKTYAAIRIYINGCYFKHSRRSSDGHQSSPEELGRFLNYTGRRDNLTIKINKAVAEIKATGAFRHAKTTAVYERVKGRSHAVANIWFEFDGDHRWNCNPVRYVPPYPTELEIEQEIERQRRLEEDAEQIRRESRRAAWEAEKEMAVVVRTQIMLDKHMMAEGDA